MLSVVADVDLPGDGVESSVTVRLRALEDRITASPAVAGDDAAEPIGPGRTVADAVTLAPAGLIGSPRANHAKRMTTSHPTGAEADTRASAI